MSDLNELDCYDAGLLNDFGGGNVEWWQDYIRAELARAHDFYQSQLATPTPATGSGGDVPIGYVCGSEIEGYRAKRYALAVNEYKTPRFDTAIYTHPAPAGGDAGGGDDHV